MSNQNLPLISKNDQKRDLKEEIANNLVVVHTERNVNETQSKRKRSIALCCFHLTEIEQLHITCLPFTSVGWFCVSFVSVTVCACLTFESLGFVYVCVTFALSEYHARGRSFRNCLGRLSTEGGLYLIINFIFYEYYPFKGKPNFDGFRVIDGTSEVYG